MYAEEYREQGLRLKLGVRHAVGQESVEEHFGPQIFKTPGVFQQIASNVGPSASFRHPVLLRRTRGSKLVGYPCA